MISHIRKGVVLALLLGLVWLVDALRTGPTDEGLSPGLVTLLLGFSLLASHIFARFIAPIGLPLITGYLLAGVILGPHLLDIVGPAVIGRLSMINQIALGLIALSAGGELAFSRLRPRLHSIGWVTFLQTTVIFGGTVAAILVAGSWSQGSRFGLDITAGLSSPNSLACALILGLIATANSPASTVAVITEEQARGPLSTLALGVTVLKDVVVLVLIAIVLMLTTSLVNPQEVVETSLMTTILTELGASVVAGLALGGLLILYLERVNREVALFLLAVVLLTIEGANLLAEYLHFHLHFLIVFLVAGFVVENASERGDALIRALKRSSLPIYVIFFTFSGVGLDVAALRHIWPLALGFALWRGILIFSSTWGGTRLAGEKPIVRATAWTSFLAQAGVSLGLAELVAANYPELGERIKTLVLAVIALNQLIGPVLFKWSLRRAGESGQANGNDTDD